MPTLGEQLRKARHNKGLTIPDLSAKSGVSFGSISDIENDKQDPRASTLRKMIKAMGYKTRPLIF